MFWIPITTQLPPLGECIIVTIHDSYRQQTELRYPVYYLKKPYEPGYAFFFGSTDNPLLPEYSEVIAWMKFPRPYEDEVR